MFRVFGLFMLVGCAMNVMAQDATTHDAMIMTMPGKLVSVGTHRLHINCTGSGTPTVVIDSGLGGFSLEWDNVQKSLSESMQICTYDRAGYGWSDPGPEPRNTQTIATELHTLLVNAEIPGPYILVGHSFGGYNIRYYASLYPQTVLGMVLIDASHPEQFERLPQVEVKPSEVKRKNSWTVALARPVLPDNYPAQARQLAFLLMSSYKAAQTQAEEWEQFRASAQQVIHEDHLPDVALTVVTRGKRVWPQNDFGNRSEQVWAELQGELSHLTSHADQIIASKSGHLVHLDEPQLVISAIMKTAQSAQVIEEVRLARLQLQKKSPLERQMLLVSNHYPARTSQYYGYLLNGTQHMATAFRPMTVSWAY